MPPRFLTLASIATILLLSLYAPPHTQAVEPGLILRFGETDADARVARQAALFVPAGEPASAYVPAGQVVATWEGILNLESRSRLIFTLEGNGSAKLSVDGELLIAQLGEPSEEKRFRTGEHPIKIEYIGPADGDTQIRLFWQERDFGKEPIPASAFTHDASDPILTKQNQLRRGHELIKTHRCASCHGDAGNAGAPSLNEIGARLESAWLARWIADPKAVRPTAHMPKLFVGEQAAKHAADIAQFLSKDAPAATEVAADAEAIAAGGHLFHQQGCIGCHTLDAKGDGGRIGLAEVAHKFRPSALAAFLGDPATHHADTRMPHFGFGVDESKTLAAFLRSLATSPAPPLAGGDPLRGEKLLHQSGCINCHQAGDLKSTLPTQKALPELSSADCKGADFSFAEDEQQVIAAALGTPTPPPIRAEFAAHEFTALRCAACHSRDGAPAFREQFAGEVAHLKPPEPPADEEKPGTHKAQIPQLDHLGFKLLPNWRERLLKGEVEHKVRPWLPARMPAFPKRAQELAAGFSNLAGLPHEDPAAAPADPEMIKVGTELAGITGFTCGTCHGIGDKPAFAVFEGEGPNFRDAGARLRREYFHLWMNDPLRQWPGTIMPKYASDGLTPLTQHYDGHSEKQFEAIYQYLRTLAK